MQYRAIFMSILVILWGTNDVLSPKENFEIRTLFWNFQFWCVLYEHNPLYQMYEFIVK